MKDPLWLPKEGEDPDEYADAFAINLGTRRLAVSDGASDALFSGRWARLLVEAFTTAPALPLLETLQSWLNPWAQKWVSEVPWEQLPYYAERKALRGAFATLLVLALEYPREDSNPLKNEWFALALGDSCLFQIREDALLIAFPIEKADDFNNVPPLLGTRGDYNQGVLETIRTTRGEYEPGDTFLLTSDALAKWFLRSYEAGEMPWKILRRLSKRGFEWFVAKLRQDRAMRNDDVTLLIATVQK